MSQFPKPLAKPLRARARPSNLNATISAPGSPKAHTSRRTMASGSLGTSVSTSAPSSLNSTMRSTSRNSKKAKMSPTRTAYMEYLIARAMEIAVEMEADKRAEDLTSKLISLEMNDDEASVTLNNYEMRIKEVEAFIGAKKKFQEQIETIDCQLELKNEVMEILARINGKLQSMDKLVVKNIETHESEWDILKNLMEECDQVMDQMINNSKDFNLTLEIKENLDEFNDLRKVVSKQLEKIHRELEVLEADTVIALGSKIKQ